MKSFCTDCTETFGGITIIIGNENHNPLIVVFHTFRLRFPQHNLLHILIIELVLQHVAVGVLAQADPFFVLEIPLHLLADQALSEIGI